MRQIKLSSKVHEPSDKRVEDAVGLIQQWYYAQLRDYVREIEGRFNNGEFDSPDQVSDAVHETADNSHMVIYPRENYMVMLGSHTTIDEALEEMGMDTLETNDPMFSAKIAYAIVAHDLEKEMPSYHEWFEDD